MGSVDRRQFLKAGAVAAASIGAAKASWGSFSPEAFPGPAGAPAEAQGSGKNLIAHGDSLEGVAGALPEGWSSFAGNPALQPSFKLVAGGPGGKSQLLGEGNGRKECYGYVRIPVRMTPGKWYRMQVRFRFSGFENVNRNLVHGVFSIPDTLQYNNGIFHYRKDGEWATGEARFQGPPREMDTEVRLYFRYSAQGQVWWDQVLLEEAEPVPSRPVKVAVSWGHGGLKHWEPWLDAAGSRGADVVLLPELFNGIWDPPKAELPDGPSWQLLSSKARQWKMYVSGTTYIRRGDLVYNTAPLFDRQGKLVGTYDKVMLYDTELDVGVTSGERFPVFDTDFGKIGIITCYDSWFTNTSRLLALQGAELALLPNEGYYEELMHARAADNCMCLAVSSGDNPAGVWDSGGNQAGEERPDTTCAAPNAILSYEKDEDMRLILATVDLSIKSSPNYWGGPMRSAPGGRRCRETSPIPLEGRVSELEGLWYTVPKSQA
jgi:predicted amidohydrolase